MDRCCLPRSLDCPDYARETDLLSSLLIRVDFLRSFVLPIRLERHADATVIAPQDTTGVDFLLRYRSKWLVGDIALWSEVERGSRVGTQLAGNLAEPGQSHVQNTAGSAEALPLSRSLSFAACLRPTLQ
jgi:hypothetical protein